MLLLMLMLMKQVTNQIIRIVKTVMIVAEVAVPDVMIAAVEIAEVGVAVGIVMRTEMIVAQMAVLDVMIAVVVEIVAEMGEIVEYWVVVILVRVAAFQATIDLFLYYYALDR